MKIPSLASTLPLALGLDLVSSLNIILNNDDGWATANIRELYKALKGDGHNAYIVAPVEQQSGQGGTLVFSAEAKLSRAGQWDTVPAGAPSFGFDPIDSHIWYYNGTPAAVTLFALDYLVKRQRIFNGADPDLVVTGPNEGPNVGPFAFTFSGTLGAANAAISRGIPAIAFSARSFVNRKYTTVSSASDPAITVGKLAARFIQRLENNWKTNYNSQKILPYGYGVNVNFPYIHVEAPSSNQNGCLDPRFVRTRLTGGAATNYAAYNEDTRTFKWASSYESPGVNTCINGDCGLPNETDVIKQCKTAVSIFTIDYDAPSCGDPVEVWNMLDGLVENVSTIDSTGGGNSSRDTTATSVTTLVETAVAVKAGYNAVAVLFAGAMFVALML
ncbi:hypothetical protein DRE_02916 [Drechslerella stenobrocha 248]|uniref:Survival protein SurE-like phosphatase/nucleotidase domain-containing protein n=1 Tax=Drechslerella stenobrocha 248 TaxID=1043628 RepID=W7HU58_9PEZI|nr:hypothetical protein DRE_02916 [Drechslerella stenobrocha 248]